MARKKTRHVCESCGYVSLKWMGRCPDCGGWETFQQQEIGPEPTRKADRPEPVASPWHERHAPPHPTSIKQQASVNEGQTWLPAAKNWHTPILALRR